MKREVWKFPVEVTGNGKVRMPSGAQVLSVGCQAGWPEVVLIWAEVDPEAPDETREFVIVGTGRPLPKDRGAHIGTVQTQEGLVWHVWYASREVPS